MQALGELTDMRKGADQLQLRINCIAAEQKPVMNLG